MLKNTHALRSGARYAALVGSVLLMAACGFKVDKAVNPDGSIGSLTSATLTSSAGKVLGYNSLKSLVFEPKCVSCHGASGGGSGNVTLDSYAAAVSAASRIQVVAVQNQTMPPTGPLSAAEREAIQAWIDAGTPEQDLITTTPVKAN